jgi:hypothetical protein
MAGRPPVGGQKMSNEYFEGQPDGEWDDRGDLSWEEYDWQQYLARHEQEVERFIDLYNSLKDRPDHLDEVAKQMGWEAEDWSVSEDDDELDDEADDEVDEDPYTLLRHPVYVVVRGLNRYLRRMWAHYQARHAKDCAAPAAWTYSECLAEQELNASMALQSLDMGDYGLAVCQLKLALDSINKTFSVLPSVLPDSKPGALLMGQEIRVRLFDMREVCLRVMSDCREEIRRKGKGE